MKIEVKATAIYTYELTPDEEQAVKELIKNNPEDFRFMTDDEVIANAVERLWENYQLSLYEDNRTAETEVITDEFSISEFNDIDLEDWIDNNGLRELIEMGEE